MIHFLRSGVLFKTLRTTGTVSEHLSTLLTMGSIFLVIESHFLSLSTEFSIFLFSFSPKLSSLTSVCSDLLFFRFIICSLILDLTMGLLLSTFGITLVDFLLIIGLTCLGLISGSRHSLSFNWLRC